MNVFGYAYYKFSRPYKRFEGENYYIGPIMLLSMCQACNILSLLPFLIKFNMNNWIVWIIIGFLALCNANYFLSKDKRVQYERRWSKEKGAKKKLGTVLAIAYIIFSLVVCFASLGYVDYTDWDWDLNWSWRWTL